MHKEKFIDEMLDEVKNLKDLAKEELPEVAKEYIRYNKISGWLFFISGLTLLIVASVSGGYNIFGDLDRDMSMSLGVTALVAGLFGTLSIIAGTETLLNVYLQPRRIAIKAITSLK